MFPKKAKACSYLISQPCSTGPNSTPFSPTLHTREINRLNPSSSPVSQEQASAIPSTERPGAAPRANPRYQTRESWLCEARADLGVAGQWERVRDRVGSLVWPPWGGKSGLCRYAGEKQQGSRVGLEQLFPECGASARQCTWKTGVRACITCTKD